MLFIIVMSLCKMLPIAVLEYVEGQQVCASSGTFGGIGEVTTRRYLRDIVSGLMYLHEHVFSFLFRFFTRVLN